MKKGKIITQDELRPEYDLKSLRVRKFGHARKRFGDFVKLEPDVAAAFSDDLTVNKALQGLIQDSPENKTANPYHLPTKVEPVPKELDNSIVKLEPDVAAVFSDAASVNKALRWLIQDSEENSAVPSCTGTDT